MQDFSFLDNVEKVCRCKKVKYVEGDERFTDITAQMPNWCQNRILGLTPKHEFYNMGLVGVCDENGMIFYTSIKFLSDIMHFKCTIIRENRLKAHKSRTTYTLVSLDNKFIVTPTEDELLELYYYLRLKRFNKVDREKYDRIYTEMLNDIRRRNIKG